MGTFLINASNLKNGGGLQVAHSICEQLGRYQQHRFVIVLSSFIRVFQIPDGQNVEVYRYDVKNNISTILLGRDKFLDNLVMSHYVDVVLTIFGPSRWRPRCKHLCGFARAQLLLDNPLKKELSLKDKLSYAVWKWGFKKSSKVFYTENSFISDKIPELLGKDIKVFTVTNYYNQVFDHPELWHRTIRLAPFTGTTIITISSTAVHKNLKIMIPIAAYMEKWHPDFQFRFVLTCQPEALKIPDNLMGHFLFVGKVDIAECPNLYEQADIMFLPSLMECFTATYPEAMRMEVPIVTTDLEFARGLCREAACYYSALDAEAAAEAIYRVATDKRYSSQLTSLGKKQLKTYDNYEQRVDKLIEILEELSVS